MSVTKILIAGAMLCALQAQAQSALPTAGTLVIVPAFGEVTQANDQAVAYFTIEEQDKDKSAAASRVNQKMKQGTEIIRKEDPQAILKTQGYYAYPVYPEERPMPNGTPPKPRVPSGWRVGQSLEVKTTSLAGLPRMTAQVQRILALSNLQFGLAPAATRKLDDKRIAATYQNLNERIASIASAMGRKLSDATLDTVDFEGSGNYVGQAGAAAAPQMMRASAKREMAEVSEPSFEPGETTLQMRLVGKVRFK